MSIRRVTEESHADRLEELAKSVANLPLRGPGTLATRSVSLGELELRKGDLLMRYRDAPVALVQSHNPDLPGKPGKSFLTLQNNFYVGTSYRVSHKAVVEVVDLGRAFKREERIPMYYFANQADWARTCEIVIELALDASANHLIVNKHHTDHSNPSAYGPELLPEENWSTHAAYSLPTRHQDSPPSINFAALTGFYRDIPLPSFVSELCSPAGVFHLTPFMDSYLVDVSELEARCQDEIRRVL